MSVRFETKFTREQKIKIVEDYYTSKFTQKQIAEKYGCTDRAIRLWAKRYRTYIGFQPISAKDHANVMIGFMERMIDHFKFMTDIIDLLAANKKITKRQRKQMQMRIVQLGKDAFKLTLYKEETKGAIASKGIEKHNQPTKARFDWDS